MNASILVILLTCVIIILLVLMVIRTRDVKNLGSVKADTENRLTDLTLRLEQRDKELSEILRQREEDVYLRAEARFKAISEESLRLHTDGLRAANGEQINALLRPLQLRLEEFSRACTDAYVRENSSRQSLSDHIERLSELNRSIGEEARNLTNALKNDTRQQGRWGEVILETLLERSGMKAGINFVAQPTRDDSGQTIKSESTGRNLRPDIVVFLPGKRNLIIDSKVSLKAYTEYHASKDEESRRKAGRRHIESIRQHVKELSEKQYTLAVEGAIDQVLMFIPNEGAYMAAMDLDPELWDFACQKKIVIVAPAHLFSVIHLVNHLWRVEHRSRNVEEVAKLGGLIYDDIVVLLTDLERAERGLEVAHKAYSDCIDRLTKGRQSIVRRTERLRDMGISSKKKIPDKYISED